MHLTTNDVFLRARRRRPRIGVSTVYRGVQRLAQLELLDEIAVPGSDSVVCDLSASTLKTLARKTGARIEASALTLRGRCRQCRALR